ncbi:hypothetical protein [Cryobacterium shii]|uniref:Uncharacterized protein n=1 Tax=Cryobacterium shii TaxID=1259235 RepID=A0AAQ2C7E6_9MICO|nr:hypothetical protein [Cryobacterium shii]TFC48900.1 hypothetical protein E3O49_06735 [Cryobacterium shii]
MGRLQGTDEDDMMMLSAILEDALGQVTRSVRELSDVHVRQTEGHVVEISMDIAASSWKEASAIGRGTVDKAIQQAGIDTNTESRRPSVPEARHLERSGTQLVLA